MRIMVDRWVTPIVVILAASSVIFAATWTMASRFGSVADQAGTSLVRGRDAAVGVPSGSMSAPIGRSGAPTGVPSGSGYGREVAPVRDDARGVVSDDDRGGRAPSDRSGRGRERH